MAYHRLIGFALRVPHLCRLPMEHRCCTPIGINAYTRWLTTVSATGASSASPTVEAPMIISDPDRRLRKMADLRLIRYVEEYTVHSTEYTVSFGAGTLFLKNRE
ncbi:uncharacterized protein [Temnothorax longispinosus]|uniref:uncharacterized protein n=1 Tax=Temnothorax longispinosus TaxID=300112 RepID=UPI003A98D9A5